MEVYYTETYKVNRNYIYDIEPEEFLEWLNGREPNEENLVQYLQVISPDNIENDDAEIESYFENADDFLEEVRQHE
jgi:hypothetical protein|nr:MAG TPA: hypothetical protein [Bacteriophage sp.]